MHSAAEFSKHASFTSDHAVGFLNFTKLYYRWKENETILEAGCADGRITQTILYPFIQKHIGKLHAVDISADAVEAAIASNDKSNIRFFVMDISDRKAANEHQDAYDHIFAFYLLHIVPISAWPINLYKMTRSGGQVFASIYLTPNYHTKAISAQKADKSTPWNQYFEGYVDLFQDLGPQPKAMVRGALEKVGFVVDILEILQPRKRHSTLEELKATSRSVNGFQKRVPQELLEDYWNDYFSKALSHFERDENGYFVFTMQVLVFVASKP